MREGHEGAGFSGLAGLIGARREEIVEEWARRARALPPARPLSEPALRDDVPELLSRLAGVLAHAGPPEALLEDLPDGHALQRLEHGYGIGAAAAELSVLKQTILDAWQREHGDVISVEDARLLERSVDFAVARSVSRFAEARERTLVALDRISSTAAATEDVSTLLPRLLTVLLETTEAAAAAYLFLRDDDVLRVRAAVGLDVERGRDFSVRIGEGLAGVVALTGEPVLVRDGSSDPLVQNPGLRGRDFRAVYGVPLVHEERVMGVAEMASRSAYEFSRDDQQLFRAVAGRAALLIVQARLVAEREHAFEVLEHGDAHFTLDRSWRITHLNASAERFSRRSRAELIGRVFWEMWPETATPRSLYWREYHRCMRKRVPVAFEEYFAPLAAWTEVTAYPTRDGGMAVFFRDATARKRTEAELQRREAEQRRLFAITPDLICLGGADGFFRRVNPACSAVLGYSETELLLRPFLDFVHPDDRAAALGELARLAEGAETKRFRIRFRSRAGEDVWISWNALPDPDVPGSFIAVGRDITADVRRLAFEEQLTAIVSHDLRNPLNAILLGAATLLQREELDEPTLRGLNRIHAAAERANRLIADLLDFTRIRTGQGIPIRPIPVDLHLLARDVLEEVQAAHPDRALRLEQQGDGEGECDPDRVAQLATNLVVNALQYGAPGTTVTLRTRGLADAVILEVHNQGDPIPPTLLAELFAPYRRGGKASERSGGLGLGLFIAHAIARAHGGEVRARSSAEEGTTVSAELPRRARRRR